MILKNSTTIIQTHILPTLIHQEDGEGDEGGPQEGEDPQEVEDPQEGEDVPIHQDMEDDPTFKEDEDKDEDDVSVTIKHLVYVTKMMNNNILHH